MAMVGVHFGSLYKRTHSLSRLVWSWVGGRLAPFCIHQMNRVNSRNGSAVMTLSWHCRDKHCLIITGFSGVFRRGLVGVKPPPHDLTDEQAYLGCSRQWRIQASSLRGLDTVAYYKSVMTSYPLNSKKMENHPQISHALNAFCGVSTSPYNKSTLMQLLLTMTRTSSGKCYTMYRNNFFLASQIISITLDSVVTMIV